MGWRHFGLQWAPKFLRKFQSVSENLKSELGIVAHQGTDACIILVYCNLLFKHKNTIARAPEEKKQVQKITCSSWPGWSEAQICLGSRACSHKYLFASLTCIRAERPSRSKNTLESGVCASTGTYGRTRSKQNGHHSRRGGTVGTVYKTILRAEVV